MLQRVCVTIINVLRVKTKVWVVDLNGSEEDDQADRCLQHTPEEDKKTVYRGAGGWGGSRGVGGGTPPECTKYIYP